MKSLYSNAEQTIKNGTYMWYTIQKVFKLSQNATGGTVDNFCPLEKAGQCLPGLVFL